MSLEEGFLADDLLIYIHPHMFSLLFKVFRYNFKDPGNNNHSLSVIKADQSVASTPFLLSSFLLYVSSSIQHFIVVQVSFT